MRSDPIDAALPSPPVAMAVRRAEQGMVLGLRPRDRRGEWMQDAQVHGSEVRLRAGGGVHPPGALLRLLLNRGITVSDIATGTDYPHEDPKEHM